MTVLAAGSAGSALWYTTRGAGTVCLVLLTASVVLGIVDVRRLRSPRWPRFVVDGLHRNVSLLVLALLGVHILTAVLDSFAPIALTDAVIPLKSAYRPIWVGLGAVAFDLLIALVLTSVLRSRLGHRAWRAVHWLAYACWPVALVHSLGTGTDASSVWMLVLCALCVVAVGGAIVYRVAGLPSGYAPRRRLALAGTMLGPVALVAWLPLGPLGPAWARRSGTPQALLAASAGVRPVTTSAGGAPSRALHAPFSAQLAGSIRQGQTSAGLAVVDMALRMTGGATGTLGVRLQGQPLPGGGISLTGSRVTLGPPDHPDAYRGTVASLQGNRLLAAVAGRGGALRLDVSIQIDQTSGAVQGSVSAGAGR